MVQLSQVSIERFDKARAQRRCNQGPHPAAYFCPAAKKVSLERAAKRKLDRVAERIKAPTAADLWAARTPEEVECT